MASSPTPTPTPTPTTTTTTFFFFFFFLLSSLSSTQPTTTTAITDTAALTEFLHQADTHSNLLLNWTTTINTCSWHGVECTRGRVTSLSLPSLSLRGPINSLAWLSELRLLNLYNNRLNGSLLPITNCFNLKLLYLSNNDFSQQIPPNIGSLHRLLRLDLSNNNLHSLVPNEISNLTRLLTLRLQNNLLSGQVPDLSSALLKLSELNLTNNQLSGHLPEGMQRKYGVESFVGNAGLCGFNPLPICPTTNFSVVPSDPSSFPETPKAEMGERASSKRLSTGAIIAIVVGNIVAVVLLMLVVGAYLCWRNKRENTYSCSQEKAYSGNEDQRDSEGDQSKLVFYDRRKVFELEDLLRASAEMLGKGSLGTVYKAMLDEECTVAVKRLKDVNPCKREEFERYMDVMGKLMHPNIVCFRAYYYAKGEKLLVHDYLPNGSLHSLLHGNRGPGRIPLDWTTRLSLVLGAARGLARIHVEYSATKIPHGNVKSSNVLVDKNGVACISDFGLALLLSPVLATARLGGYRAPEQAETNKLSQMADVYSFGVLVLEVLTGKPPSQQCPSPGDDEEQGIVDLPSWVQAVVKDEWTAEVFDDELLRYKSIEEELMTMLHIGLACVVKKPENRPTMIEVTKMIEDIRVAMTPLGEDESRSSLSPSNTTTEDARASC